MNQTSELSIYQDKQILLSTKIQKGIEAPPGVVVMSCSSQEGSL